MNYSYRAATPDDAERLLEIYAPYVKNTAISFEYEVPTKEEFATRIADISSKYPYIIMESDGIITGYAYASAFKTREAYKYSVETTIYMDSKYHGMGLGRALYTELENRLRERGILNANACIAYAREDNSNLTNTSMYFHEKMGYKLVGTFHNCGFKFGQFYDMIWMEKMLNEDARDNLCKEYK